jgi:hypothetical protein
VSAGLSIIGGVALFLFYALEAPRSLETGDTTPQVFGPLSDYAGLFQFLFMLPLTMALYQLAPARNDRLSRVAEVLGAAGLLTAVVAQALLVTHVISFEVNLPVVLVGLVLIGVWMVVANRLGRAGGTLPLRLAWLGEFTGAVFVLLGGLVLLLTPISSRDPSATANIGAFAVQHPLLIGIVIVLIIPGLLANFIGVPIWLIWLGHRLLASEPGATVR